MPLSPPRGQIGDTCFWLAAFDKKDKHHQAAAGFLEKMSNAALLFPWPLMYEVLRTRMVKRPEMMLGFERVVRRKSVIRIPDEHYRDECLEQAFQSARNGRPISLVDLVVRAVIQDRAYHITHLLTYNPSDFSDVCKSRNVRLFAP